MRICTVWFSTWLFRNASAYHPSSVCSTFLHWHFQTPTCWIHPTVVFHSTIAIPPTDGLPRFLLSRNQMPRVKSPIRISEWNCWKRTSLAGRLIVRLCEMPRKRRMQLDDWALYGRVKSGFNSIAHFLFVYPTSIAESNCEWYHCLYRPLNHLAPSTRFLGWWLRLLFQMDVSNRKIAVSAFGKLGIWSNCIYFTIGNVLLQQEEAKKSISFMPKCTFSIHSSQCESHELCNRWCGQWGMHCFNKQKSVSNKMSNLTCVYVCMTTRGFLCFEKIYCPCWITIIRDGSIRSRLSGVTRAHWLTQFRMETPNIDLRRVSRTIWCV